MSRTTFRAVAFDLGAQSGRMMLGVLGGGRLSVEEVCRFPNRIVEVGGHQHWDMWHLYGEIKRGLTSHARQTRSHVDSLAIDAWGVDFGLLARDGSVLGLPFSYRDDRTVGVMAKLLRRVSRERVYGLTGIQFLPINTLYQLYSMRLGKSPLLEVATDLLFMPDLFNYLLTGKKVTEYTIATTSQLYGALVRSWSRELFDAIGVSSGLMQRVVAPGTLVGKLRPEVSEETGFASCPVVATASHDTAAAVAAIPAEGNDWTYISSGTWSLVGVETCEPNLSAAARRLNFTNEGGVGGRYRLLKNVTGMWLLQRLSNESGTDLRALVRQSADARGLRSLIDPDAKRLGKAGDLRQMITCYCRDTSQPVPTQGGDYVRCIFDSLALKYRHVLEQLRTVYPRPIRRIHIVGGGARNRLLCQLTADAAGLPVTAGPAEATAIGNVMVQAMATGQVSSLDGIRDIVRRSFDVREYEPRPSRDWDKAYERFREIAG